MSRNAHVNFQMDYVTEFTCGTCEHHVYKSVWNPAKNEMLLCWNDGRQEAAEYDKHVIDVNRLEI